MTSSQRFAWTFNGSTDFSVGLQYTTWKYLDPLPLCGSKKCFLTVAVFSRSRLPILAVEICYNKNPRLPNLFFTAIHGWESTSFISFWYKMIFVMGSFCSLFEEINGALFVLLIKQLDSQFLTLSWSYSLHFTSFLL